MIRLIGPLCLVVGLAPQVFGQPGRDWPLFGGTPARNMVNLIDRNIPSSWDVNPAKLKNIKWLAELGDISYGGPVVAKGRVFVGTNKRGAGMNINLCRSIVMCFDEKTGKRLWEAEHPAPQGILFKDVYYLGLLSTPVATEDNLYYVLPECVLICADVKNGKTVWRYDMCKQLNVHPFHCGNCSPLIVGDLVFLVTGNGFDPVAGAVPQPGAPSFIAVNRHTGQLVWQDSSPGKDIVDGSWSNPAYAVIKGKPQVIFPGGDGTLYSFEPKTGKLIWKCHCHPRIPGAPRNRVVQYAIATPVIHEDKVYVGLGVYPEGAQPLENQPTYFLCIDATKAGDVSPGASYDPNAADNKNSAVVWAYGGSKNPPPKRGRKTVFGSTLSTCAVHDGLIYIAEMTGYMQCLDAKTGTSQCDPYDFKTGIWGSPYYVDGKVFICTEDGEVVVFQAGKQLKMVDKVDMDETGLRGTPVVANGVMFLATKTKLYAIK